MLVTLFCSNIQTLPTIICNTTYLHLKHYLPTSEALPTYILSTTYQHLQYYLPTSEVLPTYIINCGTTYLQLKYYLPTYTWSTSASTAAVGSAVAILFWCVSKREKWTVTRLSVMRRAVTIRTTTTRRTEVCLKAVQSDMGFFQELCVAAFYSIGLWDHYCQKLILP